MFILFLPLVLLSFMFFVLHTYQYNAFNANDMVGKVGMAVSLINSEGGVVYVNKKHIMVKTYISNINYGNKILVVGYDYLSNKYLVEDYN